MKKFSKANRKLKEVILKTKSWPPPGSAEARKILDHRGEGPLSLLWPVAQLYSARASAMQRDTAKARQSYETFFALWKGADQDIPILIEAKKEYEKLK